MKREKMKEKEGKRVKQKERNKGIREAERDRKIDITGTER